MANPFFILTLDNVFLPFDMLLNQAESSLPRMPGMTEETERIPGKDGDLLTQLTYNSRLFEFVLRTRRDDYDKAYLRRLEDKIKEKLNLARNTPNGIELLFKRSNRTYYVSPTTDSFRITRDYPGWFECRISLVAHDPYGYEAYDKRFRGTRNLRNIGNEEADTLILIDGPQVNPSFTVGSTYVGDGTISIAKKYQYNGTFANGEVLTIDSRSQTAYLVSENGRENVTRNWCGDFLVLPIGVTTLTAGFGIHVKYYNRWI